MLTLSAPVSLFFSCVTRQFGYDTGCEGAPLLPVMFVMMNMAYNISLLRLIKISSAVVSSLASTVSGTKLCLVVALPCFHGNLLLQRISNYQ
jgi:hypothetical protein